MRFLWNWGRSKGERRANAAALVDEVPRPGSRGTTIAFIHPKGMGGVLVELVQEPESPEG